MATENRIAYAEKLFEQARGRVRRLQSAGFDVPVMSIGSYITPKGSFSTSVKGLSDTELELKIRKTKQFLEAKTTVSGARQKVKQQKEYVTTSIGFEDISEKDWNRLSSSGALGALISEYGWYKVVSEFENTEGTTKQRFEEAEKNLRQEMYGKKKGHKIYYGKYEK